MLTWLPLRPSWNESLKAARTLPPAEAAPRLIELANAQIDFVQTMRLDRVLQEYGAALEPHLKRTRKLRLAVVGSSTLTHLLPSIRVGALRRGFLVEIYEGDFGMYRQEIADRSSSLYRFHPEVLLIALDAHHLAGREETTAEAVLDELRPLWHVAREEMGCALLQQTILPVFEPLLGNNESQDSSSPAAIVDQLNTLLRAAAHEADVHLLAVDRLAAEHGTRALYDPALWFRAKQEIHPTAAPLWGDHVARLLAALRGLSAKCLVLDLDNTLWGGVVGDDGLEGLLLGQGNAVGEAYLAFQRYALQLARRGVILAVCSKNDEATARAVFERHPEMLLRMKDISCFVANWQDKATNLRQIAHALNIGLDALVFADDNPFERNLIRQELPEVAVPELPEDPALSTKTLADAGYFEALSITDEDRARTRQYKANAEREQMRAASTDMASYLCGLQMQLIWSPFDRVGLNRIAQLVNKSNQFNLTTRRYTQEELDAAMRDPETLTLQLRLIDKFGDNGMIAVLIGRRRATRALEIDTWLMSCRVLGRQVEEATLNLLVEQAQSRGCTELIGVYKPTAKNGMVKELYPRLGFAPCAEADEPDTAWFLDLAQYAIRPTSIELIRQKNA